MKTRRPLFVAPPIRLWIGLLSAIGGTAVPKALGQLPPPQLFPPGWPPSSPVSYVNLDLDADSKIDFYYELKSQGEFRGFELPPAFEKTSTLRGGSLPVEMFIPPEPQEGHVIRADAAPEVPVSSVLLHGISSGMPATGNAVYAASGPLAFRDRPYYVAFRIQKSDGWHAGWLKFSPIEWPYVKLPEAYVFSSFGPESYGFRLLDFEIHPVAGEPLITGRGPGNDIALRQRSGKVFLDLPTPTPNSVLETSTDLKTWSPAPVTGSGLRQEIQPPAEGKVYYRHRPSV